MTIQASKVLRAVHAVYLGVGDLDYAKKKANNFIHRLGCKIEDGPEQEVDVAAVKALAFSVLDADCERELLAMLGI